MRTTVGLTAVTILASALTAYPTTYWVATTGNDANSCVQAQNQNTPKRTIAAGCACLTTNNGDSLVIRDGIYAESILNLVPAGTSWAAPTTVRAQNRRGVLVQPLAGDFVLTVSFSAKHYIVFEGLRFNGANVTYSTVKFEGDDARGFPNHIRIADCEIFGTAAYRVSGLLIAGSGGAAQLGGYNEILNNDIHDNGNDVSSNLYITNGHNLIEANNIYNGGNVGITVNKQNAAFPDDNIIRNNRVHDNAGFGIGLNQSHRTLVYNNVIYNNRAGTQSDGDGIAFSDNGADDCEIYNNTIYGNAGIGVTLRTSSSERNILKNNIAYYNTLGQINNNGTSTTLSNNLTTNPSFVNATGADFHLQTGSAAIGAGVDLSGEGVTVDFDNVSRPQGGSWDIGAYEYMTGPAIEQEPTVAATQKPGTITIRPASSGGISVDWNGQFPANASIYSLNGRPIASLNNVVRNGAGWNVSNSPAGVYFVRVRAGDIVQTTRMFLGK